MIAPMLFMIQMRILPFLCLCCLLLACGARDGAALMVVPSNPNPVLPKPSLDTTDKFPRIPQKELMDLVQRRTIGYFWEGAHPFSGLALERSSSGDVVTSGGSGFGIMALLVAADRAWIPKDKILDRLLLILTFLDTKADKFHGAFPHWLNGRTGKVIPFSAKDDGADLVETAYLMQGLLCAKAYFSGNDPKEIQVRSLIQKLWEGVDWAWFAPMGAKALFWHWSPNVAWQMNLPIQGWNECLIVYVLAAASPTHAIDPSLYHQGWTRQGAFKNGKSFLGISLPLGPDWGGPLFFSQYSFLGLDPRKLRDAYAHYWEQNLRHTQINYAYCVQNPKGYLGYGPQVWGLSASDVPGGYAASDPSNDQGTICPTAALSAMPYLPEASLRAMEFYYYKLGNRLFGTYGFYDAFHLNSAWVAKDHLAIDQGPMVIMMENYRSGLLWKCFMQDSEVQKGLKRLGFEWD